MKRSLFLLLGAALLIDGCAPAVVAPYGSPPPPVGAASVSIAVDDRPYYLRGPYYVERGVHYVWVPGHWSHRHGRRVWIHGHYAVRR